MTNMGWICPKCGKVWAPGMPSCQPCNSKLPVLDQASVTGTAVVALDTEPYLKAWESDPSVRVGVAGV